MGKPAVAAPECLAVLLRTGEEAPDLRVLLENVIHLHGCVRDCWRRRYMFMSIFVWSDDPPVGETRHNRHRDLLYSARLPANCLHPQSHRTSPGARSDALGLSPSWKALLAGTGVLQGGGVEFLLSPPAQHPHGHRHHPADDPAGPGAHRREPPLFPGFLGPPALQRPDPGLKFLVLRLHCLQRLTDPLHIPVRLVNELPGSLCVGHPGTPGGQ